MQVTWNKKALNQLDAVMGYGRREFGERTVQRLYTRITALWDTRREPHTQADNLK